MDLGKLSFRFKVLVSICIPIIISIVIGIISYTRLLSLNETDEWVDYTYQVMIDSKDLVESAVNMETGERGYILSGKEEFLEPYTQNHEDIFEQFKKLKDTVSHNPQQVMRLEEAEEIMREWTDKVASKLIKLRRESDADNALELVAQKVALGEGKGYFDRFRRVMDNFVQEEERLLLERQRKDDERVKTTIVVIFICIIIAAVSGLFLAFVITRSIQRLVGGEPAKISEIAQSIAQGNLEVLTDEKKPTGILAALTEMISVLRGMVSDIKYISTEVGEGKITTRGDSELYQGGWKEMVLAVNNTVDTIASHIDQIPSPFMIIDKEYNVLYMNKTSCKWVNQSAKEVLGKKCYDLFRTSDCQTANCACSQAIEKGLTANGSTDAHPGNSKRFVSYNGMPLNDKHGTCVGALEVFVDQTDLKNEDWLKSGLNDLNSEMSSEKDPVKISQKALNFLAEYLNSQVGATYLSDEDDSYTLTSSYAYKVRNNNYTVYKRGESMIGQAAQEQKMILFTDVPEDHIPFDINSGIGISTPRSILVFPMVVEGDVLGVMALGRVTPFSEKEMEFINRAAEGMSINLSSAQASKKVEELLRATQVQAEELESQQEELRVTNEELEKQTEELRASEEHLQTQQEELRVANEELVEKSELLERQKDSVEASNREIEESKKALELKARELEQSTQYKSEFLANMSHELRTPLNSLLLLAKKMTKNSTQNLTEKQIQDAEIIYKSGSDLLELINDILDLSKVESGKMSLNLETVYYADIIRNINNTFSTLMEEKGLEYSVTTAEELQETLVSDQQRIEQVLKNLISNALKFTSQGSIKVHFYKPEKDSSVMQKYPADKEIIAISVADTGTGIPEDKQRDIFEAFQQADGSIVRKYGGTGLGLSICKEIAKLLGGEIQLESTLEKGSVFTLYLNANLKAKSENKKSALPDEEGDVNEEASYDKSSKVIPDIQRINDDRSSIDDRDNVVLIIEDDSNFAQILYDVCHEYNIKCIHSVTGEEGLSLVKEYPVRAVILDIKLPGIDGWTVLKRLKAGPQTKQLPVHMISVKDKPKDFFTKGAVNYLKKPVNNEELEDAISHLSSLISNEVKKLLVVDDDHLTIEDLTETFQSLDIDTAVNGESAYAKIIANKYDCIILDLVLPDISGLELLKKVDALKSVALPPVIIYTAKTLTEAEFSELNKYASSMISKCDQATGRLIDEVFLFLHMVTGKKDVLPHLLETDFKVDQTVFRDKKIMIVDDDARNIYSLISALEQYDMQFIKARNGKLALEELKEYPDIDLILMDIMMPEMDGYETIRRIREMNGFKDLPIIALTAKGMKKDRELCFEAGATDYLTKPVDVDKLLSTMRVWLHQ